MGRSEKTCICMIGEKNIAQKGVFTLDVLFMSTGTLEIFPQKFAVFEEAVCIFFFSVVLYLYLTPCGCWWQSYDLYVCGCIC